MYMKPTFPAAGFFFSIQACAHSMAAGSMHIGSGPGVVGLSGMHVKAFVPLRMVRILPSASTATIVAFFPTFGGAADSALAMSSASVGVGFAAAAFTGVSAADAPQVNMISAAPINNWIDRIGLCICILPLNGEVAPQAARNIGPSAPRRPADPTGDESRRSMRLCPGHPHRPPCACDPLIHQLLEQRERDTAV